MSHLDASLWEVAAQLESVAERLTELAMEELRAAADAGEDEARRAVDRERRINRARAAVEKAVSLLGTETGE